MTFPMMPCGRDTIINRRFVFPSTIMRSGYPMMNCCNSFWGKMMQWQMGMGFINSMLIPYKKPESFYPGVNFSGKQQTELKDQYDEYKIQLEQKQGMTAIQGMYGDKYRLGVIDGKLFAVSKDYARQLSADTLTELMDAIKLDIEQHPEPVKKLEVVDADPDDNNSEDNADNILYEGDPEASVTELSNGLTWQKTTNAESFKGKLVDDIVDELEKQGINVSTTDIVTMSPNAFDSNYKLVDPSKLRLPSLDKSVHVSTRMNYDLNAKKATIVTTDGKIYTYTSDTKDALAGDGVSKQIQEDFYKEAAEALGKQAKADGWANLTICVKTETDGDPNEYYSTGETGKNAEVNKELPYTVRFTYSGGNGQNGETSVATAFMPNGEFVKVEITKSSYQDVIKELKQAIKNKGWSHTRLAQYDGENNKLEYTEPLPNKELVATSEKNPDVKCYKLENEYIAEGQIVFGWIKKGGYQDIITATVRVVDKDGNDYTCEKSTEARNIKGNFDKARKYLVDQIKAELSKEKNLIGHTVKLQNKSGIGGSIGERTIKVDGKEYEPKAPQPTKE